MVIQKLIKQVFILTILFVSKTLFAQQPSFVQDSLDSYIKREMKAWQIPALAVAVVKDGKIIHLKGYGTKGVNSNEVVDENTLFMIGSNTKLFTATALAKAEHDKKLSLDDKAKKWLPYFKLKDSFASNAASIKDLLSHRLGFETFQGDFTYWGSKLSREEIVKKMALINAAHEFRTTWGYSNAAFVASGEILQKATGDKWENYIKKNILVPLKMNNTITLTEETKTAKNIAYPHTTINGKITKIDFPLLDNLAPAGSISSSAKDMANWVLAQTDFGKLAEEQALPQEAIIATQKPQSIMAIDPRAKKDSHIYLYGLGVDIQDRANKLWFGHTGGVNGFTSSISYVPEERLGVVVLTNTDVNALFLDLNKQITDAYLGIPYENYSAKDIQAYKANTALEATKADELRTIVNQKNKPNLPIEKFTGDYSNELYGDVSVKLNNKELVIYFSNHPNLTAKLGYLKDNKFLCDFSVPMYGTALEFPFTIENGQVTGFTLSVNSSLEFTTYDFKKK